MRIISVCPCCGRKYENYWPEGYRAWCSVGCELTEEQVTYEEADAKLKAAQDLLKEAYVKLEIASQDIEDAVVEMEAAQEKKWNAEEKYASVEAQAAALEQEINQIHGRMICDADLDPDWRKS